MPSELRFLIRRNTLVVTPTGLIFILTVHFTVGARECESKHNPVLQVEEGIPVGQK